MIIAISIITYISTVIICFITFICVGSNILTRKLIDNCSCPHAILCTCKRDDTFLCKISDFDLVNDAHEPEDTKWMAKLNPNPGGSKGMIAPEVLYFIIT